MHFIFYFFIIILINIHIINFIQIIILYIVPHRCFMLITNTNQIVNVMLILFSLDDYALLPTEIGNGNFASVTNLARINSIVIGGMFYTRSQKDAT